jgi:hypothetical protein
VRLFSLSVEKTDHYRLPTFYTSLTPTPPAGMGGKACRDTTSTIFLFLFENCGSEEKTTIYAKSGNQYLTARRCQMYLPIFTLR